MIEAALPGILSSLIVGMAAAWFTAQKVVATMQVRLDAVERTVTRIETRDRESAERLVRLETKMDVLIALRTDAP